MVILNFNSVFRMLSSARRVRTFVKPFVSLSRGLTESRASIAARFEGLAFIVGDYIDNLLSTVLESKKRDFYTTLVSPSGDNLLDGYLDT